jgi:hypothetical protein
MARTINIDEIEDGMILQTPLINKYGQVILGSGAILSQSQKRTLKMWGIEHIVIESEDSDDMFVFDENILTSAQNFIKTRITWQPRNILEEELVELGIISYAFNLQRNNL